MTKSRKQRKLPSNTIKRVSSVVRAIERAWFEKAKILLSSVHENPNVNLSLIRPATLEEFRILKRRFNFVMVIEDLRGNIVSRVGIKRSGMCPGGVPEEMLDTILNQGRNADLNEWTEIRTLKN